MVFKRLCVLVLWTKVASALEGLKSELPEFFVSNNNNLSQQGVWVSFGHSNPQNSSFRTPEEILK